MNSPRRFVAGDWGTSHLRLFLCEGTRVLDRREGPGIARIAADPETLSFIETLAERLAPWIREHGNLEVWFAGMVGSRNGWRETAYVPAPADSNAIAAGVMHFDAAGLRIAIAPGLSCANPLGAPDLMRGEETQICGALLTQPGLAQGRHVIVLPGTHTKWALVEEGRIVTFQTTFTGELFGLLAEQSMLMRVGQGAQELSSRQANEAGQKGFELGLARAHTLMDVPLTHMLFEARSRQISGEWSAPLALGFLSGLLVSQDVQGALTLFGAELDSTGSTTVIGAPELSECYSQVLAAHSIQATVVDAADATIAGLYAYMSAHGAAA